MARQEYSVDYLGSMRMTLQMKFVAFILLTLFLSIATKSSSQSKTKLDARTEAVANLETLKKGALLVRLHQNLKSIEALEKVGRNTQAALYQKDQELFNKQIIAAFQSQYHLGSVYFFYAEDSQHILDNQLDKIVYLNNELKPVKGTPPEFSDFLVCEFGRVEAFNDDDDTNAQFRFPALIFRNSQMKQLRRPFPYYARTFSDISFLKRSPYEALKRWLVKLSEFQDSHQ